MKLKLIQRKSSVGVTKIQKDNLRSLKLGRIGACSIFEVTPSLQGRINVVKHMLEIQEC